MQPSRACDERERERERGRRRQRRSLHKKAWIFLELRLRAICAGPWGGRKLVSRSPGGEKQRSEFPRPNIGSQSKGRCRPPGTGALARKSGCSLAEEKRRVLARRRVRRAGVTKGSACHFDLSRHVPGAARRWGGFHFRPGRLGEGCSGKSSFDPRQSVLANRNSAQRREPSHRALIPHANFGEKRRARVPASLRCPSRALARVCETAAGLYCFPNKSLYPILRLSVRRAIFQPLCRSNTAPERAGPMQTRLVLYCYCSWFRAPLLFTFMRTRATIRPAAFYFGHNFHGNLLLLFPLRSIQGSIICKPNISCRAFLLNSHRGEKLVMITRSHS